MDTKIKLDKNYRAVVSSGNDAVFGIYSDDLNEKIERILKLKREGKIDDEIAKQLIKLFFAKYLEKDVELSIKGLFQESRDDIGTKILFLRFINKTLYV